MSVVFFRAPLPVAQWLIVQVGKPALRVVRPATLPQPYPSPATRFSPSVFFFFSRRERYAPAARGRGYRGRTRPHKAAPEVEVSPQRSSTGDLGGVHDRAWVEEFCQGLTLYTPQRFLEGESGIRDVAPPGRRPLEDNVRHLSILNRPFAFRSASSEEPHGFEEERGDEVGVEPCASASSLHVAP